MNEELKLPLYLSPQAPVDTRPAVMPAALATLAQLARRLRRADGIQSSAPERSRGYAEFTARRHPLR